VPDTRSHRGPHPDDPRLFSHAALPSLRAATHDLAWLQSRGYADPSALKLVGDRHRLDARQRSAVQRASCPDAARDARLAKRLPAEAAGGSPLLIDAYNVLTTLEVALGHGVVLRCRDSAHRDIAGLHGTWRKTAETPAALTLLGRTLATLDIPHAHFLLDSPVSNSARLATLMRTLAAENHWPWTVDLVPNPDPLLAASPSLISTADSVILDACTHWFDLVAEVLSRHIPTPRLVDLS
jgi:hypothetical protein